jgi:hypothetical protein
MSNRFWIALGGYEVLAGRKYRLKKSLVEPPPIYYYLCRRDDSPFDAPVISPVGRDEFYPIVPLLADFIFKVVQRRPAPKEHDL